VATIVASTNKGLLSALKSASAGDVISLTGGTYSVNISGINKAVTVTTSGGAVFSHLAVAKSSGLTFDGVDFNAPDGNTKPFEIRASSNITVQNGDVEGVASGLGTGRGFVMTDNSDVTIQNMSFHGFQTGVFAFDIDGLEFRNNTMTNMGNDGLIAGSLFDSSISGNVIDLAVPAGRIHSDGLQFFNNAGNVASTDLVIEDNLIRTHNNWSHGIFFGNAVANNGGGASSFYQNVTIEGNTIVSGDGLGLSWAQTNGLDIHQNIVIRDPDLPANKSIPSIRVAWQSTDVEITDNVVQKKSLAADAAWQTVNKMGSNWEISDKLVAAGTTLEGARSALADLQAAPGSGAEGDVFHFVAKIGGIDSVAGVDFDGGDTVVLDGYRTGTFKGEFASADGTSVTIDSLADLKAIDQDSKAMNIHPGQYDSIAMVIHQGSAGYHLLQLQGLGSDYF